MTAMAVHFLEPPSFARVSDLFIPATELTNPLGVWNQGKSPCSKRLFRLENGI